MSWLFWVLLIFVMTFVLQGFRKGLLRTAFSMFSVIIVLVAAAWLNPYVSDFIREKTNWQEKIEENCSEFLGKELGERMELTVASQVSFIEELPLPQIMKEKLIENNNGEIYQQLAVETFADYISGYLAHGIINGIAFLVSFIAATIIMKIILYVVDRITELPVIGLFNRLGGIALGAVQGILWIWIIFLLITLLYETKAGMYLMNTIQKDPILLWLYDRNCLVQVIMGLLR